MFLILLFLLCIIFIQFKYINLIGKKFFILYTLFLLFIIKFNDTPSNYNINYIYNWYTNINISLFSNYLFNIIITTIIIITFIILLYSIDYMWSDNKLINFLLYMFIFSFVMTLAVLSNDNILIFFSWECIGVTSFLLIGFWWYRIEASKSGNKAIIMNKFGDINLFIFLTGSWLYLNNFNIDVLNILSFFFFNGINVNFNCKFFIVYWLILAAITKSAQIILSSWLTDAMEGPTPVSALLHSATMVGIGYILLLKFSNIVCNWKFSCYFLVFIGICTIIFTSIAAYTNSDIKALLANSTSAQLGYMFLALGSFQLEASVMHFTTHAFYKSLLFLSAGWIIHIKDLQDNRVFYISKLKFPMHMCFIFIGLLSLIGIPSTFGSFSKESIIMENIYEILTFNKITYIGALIGLILTLFYNINLFLKIFKKQHNIYSKKFLNFKKHWNYINISISLYFLSTVLILGGIYLFKILNTLFFDLDLNLYNNNNKFYINCIDFIWINFKILPIYLILLILILYISSYYKYFINNIISVAFNDSSNRYYDKLLNYNVKFFNNYYNNNLNKIVSIFYNILSLDIWFIYKNNINKIYRNYFINNTSYYLVFFGFIILFIFTII